MRSSFPLFQSHLDLAHSYWSRLIKPGDIVIDATCGNGQDTYFLSNLALKNGKGQVYGLDIQPKAIDLTRSYLQDRLPLDVLQQIELIVGCHSQFPDAIQPSTVATIVYNLGYLPGGDKSKTTQVETTLKSLQKALILVKKGGLISITCYPGHEEGSLEQHAVIKFVESLPATDWSCCHHLWTNRKKSPSLLIIQKA